MRKKGCIRPFVLLKYSIYAVIALVGSAIAELGSCPPTLPVEECSSKCSAQATCPGSQMCCPTACGGAMCVDPMTQRHFVNLVKQGRCPEYPRGAWICTHTCTGDSDCSGNRKCCANRCGALTCQTPESNPEPADSGA
ncbi:Antileukoproteinase [Eumeta japonica]|uniref:Antileukoproteinase n=1 Tax=Eumeta variegata TaxID=151549 RepID=A0A4C1XKX5_EUMVA|nr:Antileukoproteinase [Eumeta japonica]